MWWRVLVLAVVAVCVSASSYNIAILSDMHIGESSTQIQLAQEAVAAINGKIRHDNILFVIVTGDVSNTALPEQFQG
jgi:3',5'-cyclic AMP phosphodiesterase CpdA